MAEPYEKRSAKEEVLTNEENYGQFHHNIDPDCPVCQKPVFWRRMIVSSNRAYHTQCFICSYCSKPLKIDDYSSHGSKLFCNSPCFNQLVVSNFKPPSDFLFEESDLTSTNFINERKFISAPRCASCEKVLIAEGKITETKLELEKRIAEKQQYDKEGKKIPKQHRISSKCVRCSKSVYAAEYCYSMSYPIHLACLRCSACNRLLQPGAHAIHNQLPYCTFPCYHRLFAVNGYRRGLYECRP